MENDDKLMQVRGDELLPGRVLDHAIARHVFGWKTWTFTSPSRRPGDSFKYDALVPPEYDGQPHPGMDTAIPAYSTDIAAAWTVVEHLMEQDFIPTIHYEGPRWVASFDAMFTYLDERDYEETFEYTAVRKTAPHAICLAALKISK